MNIFSYVTCAGLFFIDSIRPGMRFHAFSIPTATSGYNIGVKDLPGMQVASPLEARNIVPVVYVWLLDCTSIKMFEIISRLLWTRNFPFRPFQFWSFGIWTLTCTIRLIALCVPWPQLSRLCRCSGGPKNGRQMPPGHAVAKSLRRTVGREYWWQKCRPVGALRTSWEKMSCHFSLINRRSGDI